MTRPCTEPLGGWVPSNTPRYTYIEEAQAEVMGERGESIATDAAGEVI